MSRGRRRCLQDVKELQTLLPHHALDSVHSTCTRFRIPLLGVGPRGSGFALERNLAGACTLQLRTDWAQVFGLYWTGFLHALARIIVLPIVSTHVVFKLGILTACPFSGQS